MKKVITIFFILFLMCSVQVSVAQCSMCTKTALQIGEKPAKGLNQGILYLMFTPLIIMAVIGYRWWRNEKATQQQ
ncbi:MAG: hypothetical protein IPJ81_15155 [Chitinophagaceae bacterium]|nr:hypothetical protein [Chitinophagaceae bacterium]